MLAQLFKIKFTGGATVLAGLLIALTTGAAPSLATEESSVDRLYREFGLRYASVDKCFWARADCQIFVIDDVREGSLAFNAGLKVGDVISESQARLRSQVQPKVSLEEYSKQAFESLWQGVFEVHWRCQLTDVSKKMKRTGKTGGLRCWDKVEGASVFMLGQQMAETHVGMTLDDDSTVTSIIEPSPASVAGVQVGDRAYDNNGKLRKDRKTALEVLSFNVRNILFGQGNWSAFDRNGKVVKVTMPALQWGEVLSPELAQPELTVAEKEAFDLLPDLIRPLLTALYGGRFERAEFEKQVYYRVAYKASIISFMGENAIADAVKREFDNHVEQARFGPLLAQYALVKANSVGTCGDLATTFTFTEKQVETISNGYGVVLSRSVIAERQGQFDVDARFAPFVRKSEKVSPSPRWVSGIRRFIEAAGGCGSSILSKLEENMIAYQSY